jgi:Arc/MetJ-type ribon-helix-helix transcriptional regulator
MSDMASQRLTVRIPAQLRSRIRDRVRTNGQTPSDLVRLALESYLTERSGTGSAYDLARATGLIGCMRRGPKDLSTNPRHFGGFGKSK